MKPLKYILIIAMLLVLLVPVTFDKGGLPNQKSYDAHAKKVDVKNATNDKVADIQLLTPLHNYVIPGPDRLVAEIRIENYQKGGYQSAF